MSTTKCTLYLVRDIAKMDRHCLVSFAAGYAPYFSSEQDRFRIGAAAKGKYLIYG